VDGFAEPPIPKGTLRGEGGVYPLRSRVPGTTPTYRSGSLTIGLKAGLFPIVLVKGEISYASKSNRRGKENCEGDDI